MMDGVKATLMLVLVVVGSAIAAYFAALASGREDSSGDDPGLNENTHSPIQLLPYLICVWRADKLPFHDKELFAYTFCDYIIYYPDITRFDSASSEDIQGTEIIAGFNLTRINGTGYETLKAWLGRKYAIMDLEIADDFSNVSSVKALVQDALKNIVKDSQYVQIACLGVQVNPKDKDATAENGRKLADIARGAILIFQRHEATASHCGIRLNYGMISKMNYERLAEGINGSMALSTTIGILKYNVFGKAVVGEKCLGVEVLNRSDEVCKTLQFNESCEDFHSNAVYLCNTNATAQALFVKPKEGSTSASWKFNIAFFDIETYMPGKDSLCPPINLKDFYRRGPREPKGRFAKERSGNQTPPALLSSANGSSENQMDTVAVINEVA